MNISHSLRYLPICLLSISCQDREVSDVVFPTFETDTTAALVGLQAPNEPVQWFAFEVRDQRVDPLALPALLDDETEIYLYQWNRPLDDMDLMAGPIQDAAGSVSTAVRLPTPNNAQYTPRTGENTWNDWQPTEARWSAPLSDLRIDRQVGCPSFGPVETATTSDSFRQTAILAEGIGQPGSWEETALLISTRGRIDDSRDADGLFVLEGSELLAVDMEKLREFCTVGGTVSNSCRIQSVFRNLGNTIWFGLNRTDTELGGILFRGTIDLNQEVPELDEFEVAGAPSDDFALGWIDGLRRSPVEELFALSVEFRNIEEGEDPDLEANEGFLEHIGREFAPPDGSNPFGPDARWFKFESSRRAEEQCTCVPHAWLTSRSSKCINSSTNGINLCNQGDVVFIPRPGDTPIAAALWPHRKDTVVYIEDPAEPENMVLNVPGPTSMAWHPTVDVVIGTSTGTIQRLKPDGETVLLRETRVGRIVDLKSFDNWLIAAGDTGVEILQIEETGAVTTCAAPPSMQALVPLEEDDQRILGLTTEGWAVLTVTEEGTTIQWWPLDLP